MQLKYSNNVAFSHVHGFIVNNSGVTMFRCTGDRLCGRKNWRIVFNEENDIKVRDRCNIREKASPLLHGHIARLSSAGLR